MHNRIIIVPRNCRYEKRSGRDRTTKREEIQQLRDRSLRVKLSAKKKKKKKKTERAKEISVEVFFARNRESENSIDEFSSGTSASEMSRICGMESRVHHSVKSTFDLLSAKKCIVRNGLKPLYGRARKFPPADSPVRSFGPVNGSQVSDERAAGIAIPFPSYIPQFIALIIGNSLPDRRRAPTEARNFLGARTNGAGATIAIPSISRRSSPRRELPLAADIPPR